MPQHEPLLLLAGLASQPKVWQPLLTHLPAKYEPLLIDPYRANGRPLDDLAAMAVHLREQLTQQIHGCCHVVAYSMGSLVALHLLEHLPVPPASLILLGPTALEAAEVLPPRRLWAAGVDTQGLLFHLTRRSFTRRFLREGGAVLREVFASDQDELTALMDAQLHAIERMPPVLMPAPDARPPTLVVVAPGDLIVPPAHSRATAKALGATVVELAVGTRHGFPIERAAETAHLVVDWLATHPCGAT